MLAKELAKRKRGEIEVPEKEKPEDPFIFSPEMIQELQLMTFVRHVLALTVRLAPMYLALPGPQGGHPIVYPDEAILVSILVMCMWQISPETLVKRLKRWPTLAAACGYEPGQIISASQLRRRRDRLGLWVYFITFCTLVYILIQRGVIIGRDWVIDSTIIDAFSRQDGQAGWSFSKRFGYKVHMLICRDGLLPIMFLLSPANANDAPWAPRLMALAHSLFGLPVEIVRADAAYFTKSILSFITDVLHAVPKIAFNPRRAGKRQLATLSWVRDYYHDRGKRGYIERLFAVLKRYFRLNRLQSSGLFAAYRHAFEVCFAILLTAWLADHLRRPDLSHSRSRLLAPC